nr:hypothetical protein [Chloroflexota bacterium]
MNQKWRLVILTVVLASLVLALGGGVALADPETDPPVVGPPTLLIRFRGVVVDRPDDTTLGIWIIGNRQVGVTEDTTLDETLGPAVEGSHVEVEAKRVPGPDSSAAVLEAIWIRVLATSDTVRPIAIRGWVSEVGDTYLVVNGLRILYDDSTVIIGELKVGVVVHVLAVRTSEGLKALKIEVLPLSERVVEFEGVIQYMGQPAWIIGGQRVQVTRQTTIVGQPRVGLTAKVRAIRQPNGLLLALLIVVQDESQLIEWTGKIERLPPNIAIYPPTYIGRWVVGGREVWVTRETEIVGTPRVGLMAHVQAVSIPRRPLTAQKIEILSATTQTPE